MTFAVWAGYIGWHFAPGRLHEIDDYVRYLDAVHDAVGAGGAERVVVLGFSQGTATASRWVTLGRVRADHLICWAGDVAHDLDPAALRDRLGPAGLTLVTGTADPYLDADRLAAAEARLHAHAVPFRRRSFDGDHRLDAETLREVATLR